MVYHVLKDGSITNDITGHVVKMEDAEAVYRLLATIRPAVKTDSNLKKEVVS